MTTIKAHLKWEWEKFELNIMCTSKENIFSKAEEITQKKKIYKILERLSDSFNEKEQALICAGEGLIDTIYSNTYLEGNSNPTEEDVKEIVQKYINY